jgi:hypothetical protein
MEEPTDSYKAFNYDQVFILLKDGVGKEEYPGYVKLDLARKNTCFLAVSSRRKTLK